MMITITWLLEPCFWDFRDQISHYWTWGISSRTAVRFLLVVCPSWNAKAWGSFWAAFSFLGWLDIPSKAFSSWFCRSLHSVFLATNSTSGWVSPKTDSALGTVQLGIPLQLFGCFWDWSSEGRRLYSHSKGCSLGTELLGCQGWFDWSPESDSDGGTWKFSQTSSFYLLDDNSKSRASKATLISRFRWTVSLPLMFKPVSKSL